MEMKHIRTGDIKMVMKTENKKRVGGGYRWGSIRLHPIHYLKTCSGRIRAQHDMGSSVTNLRSAKCRK